VIGAGVFVALIGSIYLGNFFTKRTRLRLLLLHRLPLHRAAQNGSPLVRCGSCVDGSGLARALCTFAALVGAAMCSAF
jgi:hypothetical protein